MPLATGSRLGPYEITVLLGAGGMGEVYSARDTRLDRTVALKILPHHRSDQAEARERFEREARAIAALNHPNICQLYDVGSQDGVNYLVLEYLQGETLAEDAVAGATVKTMRPRWSRMTQRRHDLCPRTCSRTGSGRLLTMEVCPNCSRPESGSGRAAGSNHGQVVHRLDSGHPDGHGLDGAYRLRVASRTADFHPPEP